MIAIRLGFKEDYIRNGVNMVENEMKMFAFVVGIILKLTRNECVTDNEIQQLENIAYEIGTYDLDEREFRY